MAGYKVYKKNGTELLTLKKFEFEDVFMGECDITCEYDSPNVVAWEVGCYLTFRGEQFTMHTLPTVEKIARSGSYGGAFHYSNVVFRSRAEELRNVMFLDYVLADNQIHYTSLPNFSFYCTAVTTYDETTTPPTPISTRLELADRLKANLDRVYGEGVWTINVAPGTTIIDQTLTYSNKTCWEALCDVNTILGLTFSIVGRTITIGGDATGPNTIMLYGKNNGLVSIERAADENQKLVTRLYAYGNTRNIPHDYYRGLSSSGSMYVPNLMLPVFRETGYMNYVDSAKISSLGLREHVVFFDGSNSELPDIYPSIEGWSWQTLYDAMTPQERTEQNIVGHDQGILDVIVDAVNPSGDGNIPEGETTFPPFEITIKNIGFNINDQLVTGDTPRFSMKTGTCTGREFEILTCEKIVDETTGEWFYKLKCSVAQDNSINMYFPNTSFQLATGDKFVLLGIAMPDLYIKAAEQRLKTAATEWLADNDTMAYNFSPKPDNIFLARNPRFAITLRAGRLLRFADADLRLNERITISQLKIKVGHAAIDEYEITLSEETEADLAQRITQAVDNGIRNYFYYGGNSTTYTTSGTINKHFREMLDNDGNVYLMCDVDLASERGLTAYATTLAHVNDIMAGVLTDDVTITKRNNRLVVIGGGGGGGEFVLHVNVVGSGNAVTDVAYDNDGHMTITKGATYITSAALNGYVTATQLNTTLQGYATTSAISNFVTGSQVDTKISAALGDYVSNSTLSAVLDDYVDLTSAQSVSGVKTFTNGIRIGNAVLVWDSVNSALKITNVVTGEVANLLVSGGGTFYNE